jgi:hypothetical protein
VRRYGKSAIRPKGTPEDVTKCVASVFPDDRSPVSAQCSRKRGHGPDGQYCAQHGRMIDNGHHVCVPEPAPTEATEES